MTCPNCQDTGLLKGSDYDPDDSDEYYCECSAGDALAVADYSAVEDGILEEPDDSKPCAG